MPLQLDLGDSIYSGQPVSRLIVQRLEPSMMLAIVTLTLTVLIAIPLGVVAAWRANGFLDRAIMGFAVLGFSVPVFAIAYMLVYVFAVKLRWFPVQGYKPLSEGFSDDVAFPCTAVFCTGAGFCGPHRSCHPRGHAGGAEREFHPHRTRQRVGAYFEFWWSMR